MNQNTYSMNKSHSLRDKATYNARKKMYSELIKSLPMYEINTIIDVGVTADKEQEASNFFENFFPDSNKITALSNQDASWMEDLYKGLKFIKGNALNMPFKDNTFDLVFSSAVIEHVGCRANQCRLIRECMRISKKYIVITTPNKWYPLELHTATPFIHWLPDNIFRKILRLTGKNFFASENNLNLLDKKTLTKFMCEIGHSDFNINAIRFFCFKSNLLLFIRKDIS